MVTDGDRIALEPGEQKLVQLRDGFSGLIAAGLLVRISNIDRDVEKCYLLRQQFFDEMTRAMAPPVLVRVIGVSGG